jgi:hypothetical protein
MDSRADEMVEVLVPKKHVVAVYGYIAGLEQGRGDRETPESNISDAPQPVGPDDNEEWSPRQLRLLYDQSPPAMILILDYLSENPDREVASEELVKVLKDRKPDANSNTLAGTLGAFGRRVANRYGMESWPFDAYYSHEHYSIVYVMDGWVAEKLRSFKAA